MHVLSKVNLRQFLGNCTVVRATYVKVVRDWALWLSPLGLTFAGGLKNDDTAIHGFIFMRRKGTPSELWILFA